MNTRDAIGRQKYNLTLITTNGKAQGLMQNGSIAMTLGRLNCLEADLQDPNIAQGRLVDGGVRKVAERGFELMGQTVSNPLKSPILRFAYVLPYGYLPH
jgi:hypothetical protein